MFLLFLLLFSISLSLIIQSHDYHKSKFINSANALTGGLYGTFNNINSFFNLKKENEILLEENNRLKSILYNTQNEDLKDSIISIDSTQIYKFTAGSVYRNNYASANNYILINKGKKHGIDEDLGVITSKGIVGIVDEASNKYASVISILNSNSKISARLKKSNHSGILEWNGNSPNIVQLVDVQKQAPLMAGDVIETGGSSIFPTGIPIGEVLSFKLDETQNYYIVQVKLFNDMTNLSHVYIIQNLDAEEISTLGHE